MTAFARRAVALAGIAAVFAAQFAHVRATNFSGYDEWLYLSLASRGIAGFPYQNRPLVLLWHLPPALLAPGSLAAFYAAHALYLLLAGVMAFALVRRAAPAAPLLAFAAGALATVWAPMDHARLLTVTLAGYAGWTFATLLAALLFVDGCIRSSRTLLVLSAVVAAATVRGAEATLPLLATGPIVVWFAKRPVPRALRPWIAVWGAVVAAAAGWVVVPLLRGGAAVSYQTGLGLDAHPASVLMRLVRQLGFHLLPVVTTPPSALVTPAALLSGAVFAGACVATARAYRDVDAAVPLRDALRTALLGLVLACLGYAAFTLTAALPNPIRTQFLSAPGIALFLAGLIVAVASRAGRWRVAVVAFLGGWVAAAGTANTIGMQRDWDRWGSYGVQATALRQLVAAAPALAANTLVVLVDDAPAFPATFTFQHAVEYLYGRDVRGHAWQAPEFLYGCRRIDEGMACDPWPVIQGPWGVAPTVHRFDEIVVARRRAGRVEIAPEWPAELGPPPAGARYSPGARILPATAPRNERRILDHAG